PGRPPGTVPGLPPGTGTARPPGTTTDPDRTAAPTTPDADANALFSARSRVAGPDDEGHPLVLYVLLLFLPAVVVVALAARRL
ncbi:hypothetical protein AB0N23_22750, partial [Streptomyces sp. NPDC052644]